MEKKHPHNKTDRYKLERVHNMLKPQQVGETKMQRNSKAEKSLGMGAGRRGGGRGWWRRRRLQVKWHRSRTAYMHVIWYYPHLYTYTDISYIYIYIIFISLVDIGEGAGRGKEGEGGEVGETKRGSEHVICTRKGLHHTQICLRRLWYKDTGASFVTNNASVISGIAVEGCMGV